MMNTPMTARPITEGERAKKVEEARDLVANFGKSIAYIMYDESDLEWARALLSTSAAVRGMREALLDEIERDIAHCNTVPHVFKILRKKRAALSGIEPGADEQARGQGSSAPTDTKGARK